MTPTNELAYRIGAAARRPACWMQLFRFGLVGCSGYVVNLVIFATLSSTLGMHHLLAAIGAFGVAVANNFVLNRRWTFDSAAGNPASQALRFFTVSVAALVLNLAALEVLVSGTSLSGLTAQAIAVAVAMPFNFVGNKLWTFA